MRTKKVLDPAEALLLDAAFSQYESAERAWEQGRRELGAVMRQVGLSAAGRHLGRHRQWCQKVAQWSEEAEGTRSSRSDLVESVRRLGVVEPIVVESLGEGHLRVVDGRQRLAAAVRAGVTSLPVTVVVTSTETDEADDLRTSAEEAARSHRRVTFRYARRDGVETMRTVDVWGFVRRAERAYLVGYDQDRGARRTFLLSRVVGGITVIGAGTPPPEGFSAEENVWGPLDPESLEALEESFRKVLKEQRSTVEDLTTADAAPEEVTSARLLDEIALLRSERGFLVKDLVTYAVNFETVRRAQLDVWARMNSQLQEIAGTLADLDRDLESAATRRNEWHPGLEEMRHRVARARTEGEDFGEALRLAMEEMDSDEGRRRGELSRWVALQSRKE